MHELTTLERPGLIDEICEHHATGQGLVPWCAAAGMRYSMVRAWIDADSDRSAQFETAERARADRAAAAIDAMAQKLLNPDAETGHDWVDQDRGLDSKSCRVALDALKWSATTNAPKRYGRSVEHHHTHRIADEHLAAMRSLMHGRRGTGALASGLALPPPIDVEARVIEGGNGRDAELRAVHREFVVPLEPETGPPAAPPGGGHANFGPWAFRIPVRPKSR